MPGCEKCGRLNDLLQKERKQVVTLKGQLETSRDIARRRKKLADEAIANQKTGAEMANAAVSRLLTKMDDIIEKKGADELIKRLATKPSSLRAAALRALDNWQPDDSIHKAVASRKKDEHAMPRRGKSSS